MSDRPLSITKKSPLLGLAVPLAMSLLFFALNAVSLAVPPEVIARNLAASFAASEIPETDYSHYDTARGVNQYNDCLIGEMAVLRDKDFARNVVSPRVLVVKRSHWQPDRNSVCSILHRLIQGEAPDDILGSSDAFESYHYHRYLHGPRMLANLMLSSLTMGQARTVLQASVLATLALLGGLSLWRAFRLRRPGHHGIDPDYPLASAVMALGFGAFYGLQFYGMSLSHAPSEVVLFGFMAACLYLNLLRMAVCSLVAIAAAFGSLVAYFEFLTGPAPLGLAVLMGILALQAQSEPVGKLAARTAAAVAAYCGAFVLCFAAKVAVAGAVFGTGVWGDFATNLAYRMGDVRYSLRDVLFNLNFAIGYIGWQNENLARAAVALAVLSQMIGACVIFFAPAPRRPVAWRAVLLLLSSSVIFAWYLTFENHTVIHRHWMVRLLVWPIIVGMLMPLLAVQAIKLPSAEAR